MRENRIIILWLGKKEKIPIPEELHSKILKRKTDDIAFWKSTEYCRYCGIKLSKDNENTNCDYCEADLYNLMIIKDNKDKKI